MRYDGVSFTINRAEAQFLIHAASTDETREHLVCIGFYPERAEAVATDGHRMALLTATCRENPAIVGEAFHMLASDLGRATAGAKGEVTITCEKREVIVSHGCVRSVFHEKLTDGRTKFPPYLQVIPAVAEGKASATIAFSTLYMAEACERINAVAVACALADVESKVTTRTTKKDLAEWRSSARKPKPITLNHNCDPLAPMRIEHKDSGALVVLMPCRV